MELFNYLWEDRRVHTFPKSICPKGNVIARLEFELAYYDSTVHTVLLLLEKVIIRLFSSSFVSIKEHTVLFNFEMTTDLKEEKLWIQASETQQNLTLCRIWWMVKGQSKYKLQFFSRPRPPENSGSICLRCWRHKTPHIKNNLQD